MTQRIPYDRRWAAVFKLRRLPNRLIPPGNDNIFVEGVYTAAVWQATHEKILLRRSSSAVNIIKSTFVIGCGAALSSQERRLVSCHLSLMIRSDEAGGEVSLRGFNCLFDEFTSFLDAKAVEPPEWTEGVPHYRPFVLQCDKLAKMGPRIPTHAYFNCDFTAPEHRNRYAVNMNSRRIDSQVRPC